MHVKSIRIPDDLLLGVSLVESREHLDQAAAIRKLIRTGIEAYVARMYSHGCISLREAADRLGLDLVATIELLAEYGCGGNLDAADVLESLDRFAA